MSQNSFEIKNQEARTVQSSCLLKTSFEHRDYYSHKDLELDVWRIVRKEAIVKSELSLGQPVPDMITRILKSGTAKDAFL